MEEKEQEQKSQNTNEEKVEAAIQSETVEKKNNEYVENAKVVGKKIFQYGKDLLKDPIKKIGEYQQESNFKFTLILIAVLLISVIGFTYAMYDDYFSLRWVQSLVTVIDSDSQAAQDFGINYITREFENLNKSELKELSDFIMDNEDYNVFGESLKQAALVGMNIAIISGLGYLVISKILKGSVTFKEVVVATTGLVFVKSLNYVIAIIALLVNIPYIITISLFLILSLIAYIFLYEGFKTIVKEKSSKVIYVFALITIISEILSLVIFSKILN